MHNWCQSKALAANIIPHLPKKLQIKATCVGEIDPPTWMLLQRAYIFCACFVLSSFLFLSSAFAQVDSNAQQLVGKKKNRIVAPPGKIMCLCLLATRWRRKTYGTITCRFVHTHTHTHTHTNTRTRRCAREWGKRKYYNDNSDCQTTLIQFRIGNTYERTCLT